MAERKSDENAEANADWILAEAGVLGIGGWMFESRSDTASMTDGARANGESADGVPGADVASDRPEESTGGDDEVT